MFGIFTVVTVVRKENDMNVIIGWFLIIIAISVFLTFVLGYDWDLKDKIICVVSVDAFVILLTVAVYLIAG